MDLDRLDHLVGPRGYEKAGHTAIPAQALVAPGQVILGLLPTSPGVESLNRGKLGPTQQLCEVDVCLEAPLTVDGNNEVQEDYFVLLPVDLVGGFATRR